MNPESWVWDHATNWWSEVKDLSGPFDWKEPHISWDALGSVVFEWWSGDKKITLYFDGREVALLRVWGTDASAKVFDTTLDKASDFMPHWLWLHTS